MLFVVSTLTAVNLSELRRKNPMEQAAMASRKGGASLLLDVLVTAKDEDSDSDSSMDEDVKVGGAQLLIVHSC